MTGQVDLSKPWLVPRILTNSCVPSAKKKGETIRRTLQLRRAASTSALTRGFPSSKAV
jgi:hypothetical protein